MWTEIKWSIKSQFQGDFMNYFKILLDVLLIHISVLATILFISIKIDKQCWRTDK